MRLEHKFKQFFRLFCDSDFRFSFLDDFGFYNTLDDENYLKRKFKVCMGKELNLVEPKTFNEKLQWLKLNNRNPDYTNFVDKYLVKDIVSKKIGSEYIIPTIGVWSNETEIKFKDLPNEFVLKCTHDSGGVIVCTDKQKFDIESAKKQLRMSLRRDFYLKGREWPYKNVTRRIIAEKYMGKDMNDYKFMCFDGKVRCSFVCTERNSNGLKVTFFDNDWNKLPFERHYPKSEKKIIRPRNFDKMIELAEILSKDIPFVRVDFYEVDGKVYFGELTFFPGNGFEEFSPETADYELGNWINLQKHTE